MLASASRYDEPSDVASCQLFHALVGQFSFCLVVLGEREAHAAHHIWRLRELDVCIFDDLETIAPGIEKIEVRPLDKTRAGGFRQIDDAAAIVHDKSEMPLLNAGDCAVRH